VPNKYADDHYSTGTKWSLLLLKAFVVLIPSESVVILLKMWAV